MSKKVRQADIAERLGVSIVTVSKALSGKDGVGKELRKKIIEIAGEVGYMPSEAGIERADDKEFSVLIIVHERYMSKYGSFYSQITQEIGENILKVGSYPYTETVSDDMIARGELPRRLQGGKADAVIIIGQMGHAYTKQIVSGCRVPYIMLDFYEESFSADYVISDSFYGGYAMARYLVEKGHKKIAFVGNIKRSGAVMDRYLGYYKAMREEGIMPEEELVIDDCAEDGSALPSDKIKLPAEMPTAFFCSSDMTAGILIKRLKAEGLRVPEDVSVCGYENYIYPGTCDIGITTYEVNTADMARAAAGTIIKKLNGRYEHPRNHIIEGKIVEKESVRDLN